MLKKILILAPLLIIAILYTNREIKKPVTQVTELTSNQKIILAFKDFQTFSNTKPTVAAETLCQNGFINTTRPQLKKVTAAIIANREGVKNQDEAGITCLSQAHEWVLFSALNNDEYYCIDSTGTEGKKYFDGNTFSCNK